MNPDAFHFILALTYAEAAVRSVRAGNMADAAHQAVTALVYACLATLL